MSSTSKTPPRCSTMWEELNKIKIEGKSKLITFSVRVEKGKYLQKRKERNEKMLKTSSASEWVREACEREREKAFQHRKSSCVYHHGDLRTRRTWMLRERQIFILREEISMRWYFLPFSFSSFSISCSVVSFQLVRNRSQLDSCVFLGFIRKKK